MFKKMACVVTTCVLAAAILALATPPARAENFTWDGEFDDYWDTISASDLTNWWPDGMNNPVPDDDVFFKDAAPFTEVQLNGSRRVPGLQTFLGGL